MSGLQDNYKLDIRLNQFFPKVLRHEQHIHQPADEPFAVDQKKETSQGRQEQLKEHPGKIGEPDKDRPRSRLQNTLNAASGLRPSAFAFLPAGSS